jgi:predicted nucleotidyltransferase
MAGRDSILRTLRASKPLLSSRFKVRSLALFGSYARGDQREGSDIDLLVDVDPSIGLDFVTLADEVERLLGQQVDLVSRRAVKPAAWALLEQELIYV